MSTIGSRRYQGASEPAASFTAPAREREKDILGRALEFDETGERQGFVLGAPGYIPPDQLKNILTLIQNQETGSQ